MQNPLLKLVKPSAYRDLSFMRSFILSEAGKSLDINEQDNSGTTVLHWAVKRWYFDLALLCLCKGADPDIGDIEGNNALHSASLIGDRYAKMISLLLKYGAEINSKNKHDYTPLHMASENGYINGVQILVSKGADVNAVTKHGSSVLTCAIKKLQRETQNGNGYLIGSCTQVVRLFREKGARE